MWRAKSIESLKQRVKDELANAGISDAYEADRTRVCIRLLEEALKDNTSESRMRAYILIMHSLINHQRYGGLSSKEVQTLKSNATDLLSLEGITPESRNLGYLYGQLYQVLSGLMLSDGKLDRSIWEQYLSLRYIRNGIADEVYHNETALALRLLRRGDANLAQAKLQLALSVENKTSQTYWLATALHAKSLRLQCDYEGCRAFLDNVITSHTSDMPEGIRLDLVWEQQAAIAMQSADPDSIIAKIKKDAAFQNASYIGEALLWAWAHEKTATRTKLARVETYARKKELAFQKVRYLLNGLRAIEACYDNDLPMHLRMAQLGDALSETSGLITIEQELLFLAAAIRWLKRTNNHLMAEPVVASYRAICLRLSNGKSFDVYKIIEDLLQEPTVLSPSPAEKRSA